MAVVFIDDPNNYNVNTELTNGIPQYQDMYIYAELKAFTRSRTVFETSNSGTVKMSTINGMSTNFSGSDIFTTRWYDDNNDDTLEEGFGMTDIKIKIDSSYIPQVNIKFADVRGMSFFNNPNSPYRILFDFPPPIFELKLKGYYGKAISYRLHLTKYTTEFLADSGKYVIDANFVAVTFAPLADIPLRYAAQFGFINTDATVVNSDRLIAPRNTLELIEKIKKIYNNTKENVNNSTSKTAVDEIQNEIEKISKAIDYISNINSNLPEMSNSGTIKFYEINNSKDIENQSLKIKQLNSISEFNNNFNGNSTSGKDLFISYEPIIVDNTEKKSFTNTSYDIELTNIGTNAHKINGVINGTNKLQNYVKSNNFSDFIKPNNIRYDDFIIKYNNNENVTVSKKYIGIYITEMYANLYMKYTELMNSKNQIVAGLNNEINKDIYNKLGMTPTIKNIFNIILNDVDHFFEVLRTTASLAEKEYNKQYIYDKLVSDNTWKDNSNAGKVYAFPLVIKTNPDKSETRTVPIELAKKIGINKFYEIDLVEKFIKSFDEYQKEIKIIDAKYNKDSTGNNQWLPVTPQDYLNDGINPYIVVNKNFDQTIATVLYRYMLIKQNILNRFFSINDSRLLNKLITLYSKSEALNIFNSLSDSRSSGNDLSGNNIKINAQKYKNISLLYEDLGNATNFPLSHDAFNLKGGTDKISLNGTLGGNDMFINKNDDDFTGIYINNEDIELMVDNGGENDNNPITSILSKKSGSGIASFINNFGYYFKNKTILDYIKFTDKNLMYIPDYKNGKNEYKTRFVINMNNDERNKNVKLPSIIYNFIEKGYGNSINTDYGNYGGKGLNNFGNMYQSWNSNIFNNNIREYFLNPNPSINNNIVKDLIILSNFGTTASPFNIKSNYLNHNVFALPAIIQTPRFLSWYVGLLLDIENIKNVADELNDLGVLGYFEYVFLDYNDINKYLSEKDKNTFLVEYQKNFKGSGVYDEIYGLMINLYENQEKYKKSDEFNNWFDKICSILCANQSIYNLTSLSFKTDNSDLNYVPLSETGQQDSYAENYLSNLFNELNNLIENQSKKNEKEKSASNTSTSDIDIMTQTYYSFKNINDKWLSNNANGYGYPFNDGGKLIDQFIFVDRAMNPIDDTILNPQILADILNTDPNISIFSAISQLLSLNDFLFFPLQNFITSANNVDEYSKLFKIDTSGEVEAKPKFICMYVGGTSSYPTGISGKNGFNDDGLDDIRKANDFNLNAGESGIGTVKAFKVVFGKQGQSMFRDVKIDSKEYPETNESIQILSKLAGDEKNEVGVPKGQNLYNLYENRSYKATVNGLGNACIQPTQYFQLENTPLFNGAYVILTVEHTITPNKMETSFSGTKILKYPIPRVTQPHAVFGIDIGTSSVINTSSTDSSVVVYPNGTGSIKSNEDFTPVTRFDSMYTYKINGFVKLTSDGEKFIRNKFNSANSVSGNSLLVWNENYPTYGKYKIPHINLSKPYDWLKCDKYSSNDSWFDALIVAINNYSKEYDIDANVVAAILNKESGFATWGYSADPNSSAIGVSQFTEMTLYDYVILNNYSDILKPFTPEEISKFIKNIDLAIAYKPQTYINLKSDDFINNRPTLMKNVANNPDLMIKATCRKLKHGLINSNNLLSSAVFSYMQGTNSSKPNYFDVLNNPNLKFNRKDGSEYVYDVWNILGGNQMNFGERYKIDLFNNGKDYAGSNKIPNKNFNSDIAMSEKRSNNS